MSRGVWTKVLQSFIASFRPRKITGNLMGEDYLQNKYYEIPADPRGGKRRPTRWFVPSTKDKFDQEIPAEWESWLRNRRAQVPKPEEVLRNLAVAKMKKENAMKVAVENPFVIDSTKTQLKEGFPEYQDYELPHKKDS